MTQNDEVINSSAISITELFVNYNVQMMQIFDVMFDTLFNIVMNSSDKRDVQPFVIQTITAMFDVSNVQQQQHCEQLEQLLITFRDTSEHLNIENDEDIKYANQLYTSLCNCHKTYAKMFYEANDANKERLQLIEFDNVTASILLIGKYNIDDELVMAFVNAARQYRQHCSRKCHPIINRRNIHNVIGIGVERINENLKLSNEAKDAMYYLKS